MAQEFRLPDIGEGLTEAEVVRWVVAKGDRVEIDQTVVEVETDKAVVEIPSPFAGTVLHHGAAEGEVVTVGEVLVVIGEPDEEWVGGDGTSRHEPGTSGSDESPPGADQPHLEVVDEPELEVAAAGDEPAPIIGSISSDAEELPARSGSIAVTGQPRVQALPLVRKLARELEVDLASVTGSGPEGRITREDVEAAVSGEVPVDRPPRELPPVPTIPEEPHRTVPAGSRGESERRPLSRLRRTIAANMAQSWTQIPHVTTFDEVNAGRLLEMRAALARRHGEKIPVEALVIKAVTPVLAAFPELNATLDGDDLELHGHQDVGIAVDTPDGLLVAVIRNADRRSVLALAGEVRRLGSGAKERSLAPDELTGQTFTVSNIGALGGGFGTPIVPPGTIGILSVGRAADKPIAREGTVEIAPMLPLSLSYDHRVVDGGMGRRFIAMLIENLEEPGLFLAD